MRTANIPDPLAVLRQLQRGNEPPRIDMVTVKEIMDMLPEGSKGTVSIRWLRANVPGKRRIGKGDLWPRSMVLDFFHSTGLDGETPDESR